MYLMLIGLLPVLAVIIYRWSTAKYQTFVERGVPHEKPRPLMGNLMLGELSGTVPHLQRQIDLHEQYKDSKVYGLYFLRDPIFIIRDLELIKNVGVKDFDHFMNHSGADRVESLLSKSLVRLKDRKWKDMRTILSPTFTGSKMRTMYELINVISEVGVNYIDQELNKQGGSIELEMKDYFTRFTNDVIASAAFGIRVNSFEEKDNKFFKVGQTVTTVKPLLVLKGVLYSIMPKLMKFLRVSVIDEKCLGYFRTLVFDAIKYRQEKQIIRPDMIHLLMEAQTSADNEKRFSDDDLLAQCLLFFFAGFDTVSSCLCFLTYELCMNQEVQDKLYEEICAVEEELDGKPLDYDRLMHMKYLDMVVSEALRKWPPAPRTDRECNADVELRDEQQQLVVTLKKGDILFIPILAIHYDPEYYDNPLEFRPERFSDENKHAIKPFTYMPFGVGPRNCIGNRMALMEVKSIVYHLMLKFRLLPAKKTCKDMLNSIKGFTMVPAEKFWVKYEPRESAVKLEGK